MTLQEQSSDLHLTSDACVVGTKADGSRLFTNFGTLQIIHFTRSPPKYLSTFQMHKTSTRAQELLEPIYCDSLRCSQLFDEYLGKADLSKTLHPIAEELRSQFIRWAGYAGAFAVPKASLDAQLSPHEDIKNMFLESLNMLELNLKWGSFRPCRSALCCC